MHKSILHPWPEIQKSLFPQAIWILNSDPAKTPSQETFLYVKHCACDFFVVNHYKSALQFFYE